MMNGTTALTHEALWNAIYLLNDAVVGIFGMILSAAFCDLDWTRKRLLRYWGCMAVILLVQAAVYCVADVALLRAIYPLVTHLPLVVVLCVMKRRTIWPVVSVLTAYLCCQIRRWIALFAVACIGGGIAVAAGAPAAIGATAEDPKSFGKSIIFVALGEGFGLYGLLIAIMMLIL